MSASEGPRGGENRPSLAHRDPSDSPSYVLIEVARRFERALAAALRPLDLTGPQLSVLGGTLVLVDRGNEPSQRQIAQLLGWDEVTTGQVVRILERKELLHRAVARDRRARALSLTERGRATAAAAIETVDALDRTFFTPAQADQLRAVLGPLSSLATRP